MSVWRTLLGAGPVVDRLALAELDGAIRAATAGFAEARHALAAAIAERDRESERLGRLSARAADLEERAVLAIEAGRTVLAEAAAQAIATLETERAAAQAVEARYAQDVARLREAVERQRRRLAELDRGRRMARVNAALACTGPGRDVRQDAIGHAEALLDGLKFDHATDRALAELDPADSEALQEKLAEAGCGAPLRPQASAIMARIVAKAAARLPSVAQTTTETD